MTESAESQHWAPGRLTALLTGAVAEAMRAVGGHVGGVYLRSSTPGLLRLAVLAGLPGPLFRPWWRMHVDRPFPVADAHRLGVEIQLADPTETMRRYPQLAAGLPFRFGSVYVPVVGASTAYGVLSVVRPATADASSAPLDRDRLTEAAQALGAALLELEADGPGVVWDGEPLCVPPPGDGAPEGGTGRVAPGDGAAELLPDGVFTLDRLGRFRYVNPRAALLLGRPRAELLGQSLWHAVPWLEQPAYDDQLRGALLSRDPVHFQVRRPQPPGAGPGSGERYGDRLSLSVYPGPDGLTFTAVPVGREAQATTAASHPGRDGREDGAPPFGPLTAPAALADVPAAAGASANGTDSLYPPVILALALSEAVTARQVSAVVMQELLPAFGGRRLAIYLLQDRHLYLAWESGFPKGFLDPFDGVALDVRLPGVETLTTGRPLFFESMQQLAAAYPGIALDAEEGARAFLPLIASGRPVGSCILGFDRPRGFSPQERTVLTALAGLVAQALERAQRYDTEAALARGLQAALLPHRLPVHPRVETAGRYLPGTQGMDVGGDWYDVVEAGDGLALVIGDVQGHGVQAAATMGQLRSAVRAFALGGHPPEEVMSGTNRLLIDLDPGQFASCCYIRLDPLTGAARAARAGHPQPLLRRPDGRTEVLDLPGGVVLGVAPDAVYPVVDLHLEPGAVLALYTDGLVERPGTDIDEGIERLRAALARAATPTRRTGPSLGGTADLLIEEARQATDRPDDIALLLTTRRATR
ncbi:SpoIIE family protein phosphatase [Streptomyces sp. TLI_146]|uniref:SpoIIE family protein phosphatase n=1 Tax=Streptomyces sp. TLI_146 TaxID=1938858 RepID=UPI000C704593|nr:SpoIIE family protein phosphatase [Streptomyces sp. TLI_146]PKV89348.1 PAS domain S-box-containing protein [Streptomyces sp. TLI_146]